jgi:hypothetical protein
MLAYEPPSVAQALVDDGHEQSCDSDKLEFIGTPRALVAGSNSMDEAGEWRIELGSAWRPLVSQTTSDLS